MSILSILRHRATVMRGTKSSGETTWATQREGLPCLLVDQRAQTEGSESETQRPGDRTGVLFAPLSANLKPGDRLVFTRPVIGTYLIKPDARSALTPTGPRHKEFEVEQVG